MSALTPTRRSLLAGASALPLAAAAAPALAAPAGWGAWVARQRARWAELEAEGLRSILGVDAAAVPPALTENARAQLRGLGAYEVLKEVQGLDPAEQLDPEVQALIEDLAVGLGEAELAIGEALAAWAEGPVAARDPEGEHLRAALVALRAGLAEARTTPDRRALLDRRLADLLDDPRPGQLRAEARRALRRHRKTVALMERLSRDPDAMERLLAPTPDQQARLRGPLGRGRPGRLRALAADDPARAQNLGLGLVAAGIGLIASGFVLFIGCMVACAGGSVVVLLLGLGLNILCISLLVNLSVKKAEAAAEAELEAIGRAEAERRRREAELRAAQPACDCPCPEPAPAPAAPEAAPPPAPPPNPFGDGGLDAEGALLLPRPVERGWVTVGAGAGWVDAGLRLGPGEAVHAAAWGLVWTDRSWPADADGDGALAGPGAPLPGAPAGALVGRCGGRAFFLGAEQRLPEGLAGPLQLTLNLAPGAAARAHGALQVRLQGVPLV